MNKLSALVITIFLLLGAAMWYLANVSYAPFLHTQISQLGSEATGFNVSFETLSDHQHSTKLGNMRLLDEQGNTLISLNNLVITLDPKSFKKAVLNISQVDINGLNAESLPLKDKQTIIEKLTAYITKAENKSFPPIMLNKIEITPNLTDFTFTPPASQQGDIVLVALFKQLLVAQ